MLLYMRAGWLAKKFKPPWLGGWGGAVGCLNSNKNDGCKSSVLLPGSLYAIVSERRGELDLNRTEQRLAGWSRESSAACDWSDLPADCWSV